MTEQPILLRDEQASLDLRPNETVGEVLARIRRDSGDNNALCGIWFEQFFLECAPLLPELEVAEICTWAEWKDRLAVTGRSASDRGIDLVAHLKSGERVAVQCKFYRDGNQPHDIARTRENRVRVEGVDSFIREARPGWFDLRWVVSTSSWTKAAEDAIKDQNPPVRRIDFLDYSDREVREFQHPGIRVPHELQQTAIDSAVDGLLNQGNDRGRLVMACGTGKTFVSLKIAESIVPDNGRIVFAAPSISLVSQARKEWLTHTTMPMSSLVVCSDSTAGGGAGPDDVTCPVTTEALKIADHLRCGCGAETGDMPFCKCGVKVVFATYHSLNRVVEAQRISGDSEFHLAVADEAHRTTGAWKQDAKVDFRLFHDGDKLLADKRLYMTGTPRVYTLKSKKSFEAKNIKVTDMGDHDVYGPLLYRLKYKDAVDAGMLSDYRVVLLGVHDRNLTPALRNQARTELGIKAKVDESDVARLVGTVLAMNGFVEGTDSKVPEGGLPRTIGYASTIARSEWYRETFDDPVVRGVITRKYARERRQGLSLHAVHMDNRTSAIDRAIELRNLDAAPKKNEARLVTNVKVLSEGVDVPALDAISFLDAKQSHIEILQSFGRVMRRAPGKRYGYIIVPVFVPEGVDDVATTLALRKDAYKAVGEVLLALQHHDETLTPATLADHLTVWEGDPEAPRSDDRGRQNDPQRDFTLRDIDPDDLYVFVAKNTGLGSKGDETAQTIESEVIRAAVHLNEDGFAVPRIRRTIDIPHTTDDQAAATVAALLVINACLMHKRLKSDASGSDLLVDIDAAQSASDPVEALLGPWRTILKKDFSPIFRPALAVLESLPRSNHVRTAIHILAECASNISDDLGELGYDHAGPLYHRILRGTEAQGFVDTTALVSTGAYYTNHIPALMLAGLALDAAGIDWNDTDAVRNLRLLDPACGTGTILMAALKMIKDRALKSDKIDDGKLPELHRHLVMNGIYGLDISYQATQFAASNLTLGAPSVDYDALNMQTMDYGWLQDEPAGAGDEPSKDNVRLGSIELLVDAVKDRRPDLETHAKNAPLRRDADEKPDGQPKESLDLRNMDLVLMNPPFTNNVKRAKVLGRETAESMQLREKTIKDKVTNADPAAGDAINFNAVESFFAPLAEALANEETGVFAQVMPFTACTGADALSKRKFLASRFHIDTVVTNHQTKNFNFSISTDIHESLLICRRRADGNEREMTRFVSIRHMPETSEQVDEFLAAVKVGLNSKWCRTYQWPWERVVAGDWTPAQWYDGELAQAAIDIAGSAALAPVGEIASIGPAGRRVNDAFINPEGGKWGGRTRTRSCGITNPKFGAPWR